MPKLAKWQKDYLVQINVMSNSEILQEYTNLSGGDDYDGCFTKRGEWQYTQVTEELERRLVLYGFLKEESDEEGKTEF